MLNHHVEWENPLAVIFNSYVTEWCIYMLIIYIYIATVEASEIRSNWMGWKAIE